MSILLNRHRHRRDGSVENFRNFRKFARRIVVCPPSLACWCISLARLSVVEIIDYSQWNKEMAYVTSEGYLQEELLTEVVLPDFFFHTMYVDINFLLFSLSLCCCCFLLWRLVLKRLRRKSWTSVSLLSRIKL